MLAGDGDHFRRSVDAGDLGAEPGQRLGEQPGAAADIERRLAVERRPAAFVALPMLVDLVAKIFEPHRIEPVQHRRRAVRVPPVAGQRAELLDFSVTMLLSHAAPCLLGLQGEGTACVEAPRWTIFS